MLPALNRTAVILFLLSLFSKNLHSQSPGNDLCSNPTSITPATSCNNTSGTLYLANNEGTKTSLCGTTYDVWYSFTTPSNCDNASIDVSVGGGSNLNSGNAFIEAFSGSSCSPTLLGSCTALGATLNLTGLTPSTTYYLRFFTTTNPTSTPSSKWNFNICVIYTPIPTPPANDDCAGAILLSSGVINNSGTVWLATASSGIPSGCSTGDPDDDVWYRFTPANTNVNISLSAIGSNLSTSGTRLQLFSGTCGSLTSIACGTTNITVVIPSGVTYYIRVYSAATGSIGGTSSGSAFSITATATVPTTVTAGRMKEVYQQNILSAAQVLADPWEITYGPDNYLWITEAKGYKVYRMDPSTGAKTTVLDISQNASGYLTGTEHTNFNVQFASTQNPWPQGGMAGLVLHPNFMHPTTPENYVYVSYVRTYNGGSSPTGIFFTNRLVRFTYNTGTNKLESPVSLCDTLPGSNDHNSQRIIIAPVDGTYFLFYASGDMGAGQFSNKDRPMKAQNANSYEGKILRFNLVSDGDAGLAAWIPNDNPYSSTSAVWCIGIRNNQGFAFDTATGILYGTSHGPYTDDEINIIEPSKNYGHPLVIGYAADNNYNNSSAGAPNTTSSCPLIVSESGNAAAIGASYKDPLFSAYAATQATVNNIWTNNPSNSTWPSEGWSGLDIYKHTLMPGWKNSLIVSSLKWGRILRFKLGSTGTTIVPTAGADTVSYFGSTNRFRDVAFAPNGKDMFVIMDRSSTTSGPSAGNPIVPACGGCVQKYTFLGYADASGKSSIPASIPVTAGTLNSCTQGTTVTIDGSNNNIWVPITGTDGDIMAEIKANGQNLGVITSSFYTHSGPIRHMGGKRYMDRNITITPAVQPSSPVAIRLYFSKSEYDALDADPLSMVNSISDIRILKNNDACVGTVASATSVIVPLYAEAHGSDGYMVQANISSFSSFYFGSQGMTLPLELLYFRGNLQGTTTYLKWETSNEINTSHFEIERSTDGSNFENIASVTANGNVSGTSRYTYPDQDMINHSSLIFYYRLKMIDADGKFKYSNVITITLSAFTGRVTVFPNPAENFTNVSVNVPASGLAKWKLIDNRGRVIMQKTKELMKGKNEFTINLEKLSSGVYYFIISGEDIGEQKLKIQKI